MYMDDKNGVEIVIQYNLILFSVFKLNTFHEKPKRYEIIWVLSVLGLLTWVCTVSLVLICPEQTECGKTVRLGYVTLCKYMHHRLEIAAV